MLNFVYCLDKNYNIQLLTSINSILDRTSEKINIHIVHEEPDSLNLDCLKNTSMANIFKYKLDLKNINFPNLRNAHVSKATYFRLFISTVIPSDLDYIVYIDADIVCIKDPIKNLNDAITEISKSKFYIAAKTELTIKDDWNGQIDRFDVLNLLGESYFNAGLIIIDYQNWLKANIEGTCLEILREYGTKLKYWDQDILNKYFDGKYIELSNNLNFNFGIYNNDIVKVHQIYNDVKFLHYNGKGKPWSLNNIIYDSAEIYQNEYRKLGLNYYHVVFNSKIKNYTKFFNILLTFKFLKLKKPFEYLKLGIKEILKFKV